VLVFLIQGNTAMNFRTISLAASTIVALAPAVSTAASPENLAAEACARAFASSLKAPDAATPTYKLDYRGVRYVEPLTEMYSRGYTFYLSAKSRETGLPFARASCETDKHGVVVSLSSLPQESARAPLTALD
jgi:hypothetical protein